MSCSIKVLILAGGCGKRLWPLSTPENPKQFLMIKPGLSLLQNTLNRFLNLVAWENLFILTNASLLELTSHQVSAIHPLLPKQILLEPEQKNTGFAIAWALKRLEKNGFMHKDQLILITPSDHIFFSESTFLQELKLAIQWYPKNSIGSLGLVPRFPSKEFGYIKPCKTINPIYKKAGGFIEKPLASVAQKLVEDHWLWNIGIYLLTPSIFWQALRELTVLEQNRIDFDETSFPSLSIDHLLIEKVSNLCVFESKESSWLDVGSLQTFMYCQDYFLSKLHHYP
jgi:mannose-1-phosphate guanylyltransferase